MKKIKFIGNEKFLPGLAELSGQLKIAIDDSGYEVKCACEGKGIRVEIAGNKAVVSYEKDCWFFRAFSLAAQYVDGEDRVITVEPQFNHFGTMQNCSSLVMSVEGVKDVIRQQALMGMDYLELYTEYTYEIEGEPYFGYMKGRYSRQELQELDAYGKMLGVEMVPCIQTLGHMAGLFKWGAYGHVSDIAGTLLCDYEPTYELIEKMLRAMKDSFTTTRINLGTDEAYFMGKGRYHWFVDDTLPDPSQMYIRHVKRVIEIAKKVGYENIGIWYDNLFEINYKGYICPPEWLWKDFPKEITEAFPDVRMIIWHYTVNDVEEFKTIVAHTRQLSENVSFASMVHGYTSFVPDNYITKMLEHCAKEGCKACGIDDMMLTWWGGKSSSLAQLGGYYHYIEYCGENSGYDMNERCKFLFGYTYDELCALDLPNQIQEGAGPTGLAEGNNPCFYILADDPLLGMMEKHIPADAAEIYESHAKVLGELAQRDSDFNYIFEFESVLCKTLAAKCDLPKIIKEAYDKGDKAALRSIAAEKIPAVLAAVEEFYDAYYSYWIRFNRTMGWEKFSSMLGGLMMRLKHTAKLLGDYADGKVAKIEELEQERLPLTKNSDGKITCMRDWYYAATTG